MIFIKMKIIISYLCPNFVEIFILYFDKRSFYILIIISFDYIRHKRSTNPMTQFTSHKKIVLCDHHYSKYKREKKIAFEMKWVNKNRMLRCCLNLKFSPLKGWEVVGSFRKELFFRQQSYLFIIC